MSNIALFDMDGTLVDYHNTIIRDMHSLASPDEKYVYSAAWDDNIPEYIKRRLSLIKNSDNWWYNLPRFQLGWDILEMAQDIGFDIHILTKGPSYNSSAWAQKVQYCKDNLSKDVKITITEDKSMMYGKVLVDDYPAYMEDWLRWRPRGLGIMPRHDYNEGYTHQNVILYDGKNKDMIRDSLVKAFNR